MSRRLEDALMEYALKAEDDEPAFVCLDCFKDPWLKDRSKHLIKARQCKFCGSATGIAQTPAGIADVIREPLKKHFVVDIIGRGIGSESSELCQSVAELLVDTDTDTDTDTDAGDEDFYSHGQEYCINPSPFESDAESRWWAEGDWHAVSTELTHGQRFFNSRAKRFFESLIFEALWGAEKKLEAPAAVKEMPVGSEFYRARISKSQVEVSKIRSNPAMELGAPPKDKAANNRMSAAGVPLMYVSGDPSTCIAEVRPSIGDQVVVGKFVATKEMKFFDFTVLESLEHEPISIFNPLYDDRAERRQLLKLLHGLIARPVRSTDTDYVMTQALAEYIRYCQYEFDGVAFRSVQRSGGGVNYVLFDKSSSGSLQSPNWVPEFSLAIDADDVSVCQVDGVEYRTSLISE
ncbi:RES domain protein [compost metagenome]